MANLMIRVPLNQMDCMTPKVQQIDGLGVTAEDWFGIQVGLIGSGEVIERAGHWNNATEEQVQMLVDALTQNPCPGVSITSIGSGLNFDEALAEVNRERIQEEVP